MEQISTLPICKDIMIIILSLLDPQSLINFSMTCRKHCEISKNNIIWMNQMIKICPTFNKCCANGNNYKEIVKEIINHDYHRHFKFEYFDENLFGIYMHVFMNFSGCNTMKNISRVLKKYLENNPGYFNKEEIEKLIMIFCDNCDVEEIKKLLELSVKYPELLQFNSNNNEIFIEACRNANYLESDSEIDDTNFTDILENQKSTEIVKLLLKYSVKYPSTINPGARNNFAFIDACCCESDQTSNPNLVKLLLDHSVKYPGSIDPGAQDNEAFISACCCEGYKSEEIVKLLLDHSVKYPGSIDPGAQDNKAFIEACKTRYHENNEIVKLLLNHSVKYPNTINPGAQGSKALIKACKLKYNPLSNIDTIKLLLEHSAKYPNTINIYAQNNRLLNLLQSQIGEPGISKLISQYFN
jgi:hypothetical protein